MLTHVKAITSCYNGYIHLREEGMGYILCYVFVILDQPYCILAWVRQTSYVAESGITRVTRSRL